MDTNSKNSLRFIITGWPHSKKNSRRIFSHYRTGKVVNTPSEAYERFRTDAKWQIKQLMSEWPDIFPITTKVEVTTIFSSKGRIQFDPDNAHTGILDILQDSGLLENDKLVKRGIYEANDGFPDWSTEIIINIL